MGSSNTCHTWRVCSGALSGLCLRRLGRVQYWHFLTIIILIIIEIHLVLSIPDGFEAPREADEALEMGGEALIGPR